MKNSVYTSLWGLKASLEKCGVPDRSIHYLYAKCILLTFKSKEENTNKKIHLNKMNVFQAGNFIMQ